MNRYTIPCTLEQTKKALELGAPIQIVSSVMHSGNIKTVSISNGFTIIPTVEQMINWLENQDSIDSIIVEKGQYIGDMGEWMYTIWNKNKMCENSGSDFPTRKKATLVAIDAALEYLSNDKK